MPEAVGDFHVYPVKTPTTIAPEQMNRLLILSSQNVPVKKDYNAVLPPLAPWYDTYYGWGTANQPQRVNVQVALTFFNKEQDGLGVPLPQGSIRLYEPDQSGSLRYAGAATIQSTPKDQKVHITLARAFDVFVEARLVKTQKVDKRTVRKEVELTLHNEKSTPVDLRMVQGFSGRWKIVSESQKHVNLNANQAQWTLTIPATGKVTLRYTVDLS